MRCLSATSILLLFLLSALTHAQECDFQSPYKSASSPVSSPDLPDYIAADITLPVGSLIIPMDNTKQIYNPLGTSASSTIRFNLRSYGLVKELRKNKIPVGWVIDNDKAKDGVDISVECVGFKPSFAPSTTAVRDFVGGPFVIFPQYESQVVSIIAALPASGSAVAGWNVAVYKTTQATTVNIRHILDHQTSIGVSSADTFTSTHTSILNAAGFVSGTDYFLVSTTELRNLQTTSCYTTLTEPHFDDVDPIRYTKPVRSFLLSGANMIAQCEGVNTYESAHFLTSAGIIVDNGEDNPLQYPNPSVPFIQIEGALDETESGNLETFRINPNGKILNEGFRIAQSSKDPNLFQAMSGRLSDVSTPTGGVMFYLGGHSYDPSNTATLKQINGARMLLNAVTSPTRRPATCATGSYIAELSLSIADSNDAALIGRAFSYTATIANSACAGNALGVSLVLNVPSGLTSTGALPSGCVLAASTITCTIGTINSGAKPTYVFNFIPSAAGTVSISGTVSTTSPQYILTNDITSESTLITSSTYTATIDVAVSAPVSTVVASDQKVTYTVTVQNTGATDMTGVFITDVPTNAEILSATAPTGTVFNTETNQWYIPTLAAGTSKVLTILTQVDSDLAASTQVTNQACITKAQQSPSNGVVPCDSAVVSVSKVLIDKQASRSSATISDTITYIIEVRNTDTVSQTVNIADTIPPELTYVTGSLYQYSFKSYSDSYEGVVTLVLSITSFPSNWPGTSYYTEADNLLLGLGTGFLLGNVRAFILPSYDFLQGSMYVSGFASAFLTFSIPANVLEPTLSFKYRFVGTDSRLNIAVARACNIPGTYIWDLSYVTSFIIADQWYSEPGVRIPDEFIGQTDLCIRLESESTNGVYLDIFTITYYQPDISLSPRTPSSIGTNVVIPPGGVVYYRYQTTVNNNAAGVESATNLVAVTGTGLPNSLSTSDVVTLYTTPIEVEKSGSSTLAADGQSVTYTIDIFNTGNTPRTITLTDLLPAGLTYTPNTISATHVVASTTVFSESFTSNPAANNNYQTGNIGVFTQINEVDWTAGNVRIVSYNGGYAIRIQDAGTLAYAVTVGPINLASTLIKSGTLSYKYQRSGAGAGISHFWSITSTGTFNEISPTLIAAVAADSAQQTLVLSLDDAIASRSNQVYLYWYLHRGTSATNTYIYIDDITITLTNDAQTNALSVAPPPDIKAAYTIGAGDAIHVTYVAQVTDPAASTLTNTASVADSGSGIIYRDSHTLRDINAVDDAITTTNTQAVQTNVITNDVGDIDYTTIAITTAPTRGTATLNAITGVLSYTPTSPGNDVITYRICSIYDNTVCSTASVNIRNRVSPTANPDSFSVETRSTLTNLNVIGNDVDLDGDSFAVTSFTPAANGAVVRNGNSFNYDPNPGYTGSDSFTYTITDASGLTSTATVSINVFYQNNAPVAANDAVSVNEDNTASFLVLQNDVDADNDPLTIFSISTTTTPLGTLTNFGTYIGFVPTPNAFGTTTFTYIASDGTTQSSPATVSLTVTPVNDPPIGGPDFPTVVEESTNTLFVLSNDSDVEGSALSIIAVTQGSRGGAVFNNGGSITYTPATDVFGTETFTYTVSDGSLSTVVTVTASITNVNDAPVLGSDSITTPEDTPVTANLLANDVDPDGNTLTIVTATGASKGTTTILGGGLVRYTPNANEQGSDSFSYTVSDGTVTVTGSVSVTITPVNDIPVAVNDVVNGNEDTVLTAAVLANDIDPDIPYGDSLSINSLSQPTPAQGTASHNGLIVTFTPAADFFGTVQLTYTAKDSANAVSAPATVTFNVANVNDAPRIGADTISTNEDTPASMNVLANDVDPDGNTIFITLVTNGANGVVTFSGATVTYTPTTPNFHGTDSFTYTVSDGITTSTGTVTVNIASINDAPDARDDNESANEDVATTFNVVANDIDVDGDTLTVTAVSGGLAGSTITFSAGTVTYKGPANYFGSDSFTYTASDGNGGTDTATVFVTVVSVNDAPIGNSDTANINEDATVLIDVLANDSDIDGGVLSISGVTGATFGSASIESGKIRYTPNANAFGTETLTYTVTDGQGGVTSVTVTVNVASVNDVPVGVEDSATTQEDTQVTINVVANDIDNDGDALEIFSVVPPLATQGVVTFTATSITFTPATSFLGIVTFTYTATDDIAFTAQTRIQIIVSSGTDLNPRPDSKTTDEDTAAVIDVLANDINTANAADLYLDGISSAPAHGIAIVFTDTDGKDKIRFTPAADYNGDDSFTYRITDNNGQFAVGTVTITVAPVNDPPTAVIDTVSVPEDSTIQIPVIGNDYDVDGDVISLVPTLVSNPTSGSASITGNIVTYMPVGNFHGSDSFTYSVTDPSGATATGTVSITVLSVNDAPVATDDSVFIAEDTPTTITFASLLSNGDSDPDFDTLTISAVSSATHGSTALGSTSISYTPAANYFGTDTFTVTVSDGNGGFDTAIVSVTISSVNDAPTAASYTVSTTEDTPISQNVIFPNTDVDGDTVTASIVSVVSVTSQFPNAGSATVSGSAITYSPSPNNYGTFTVTYRLSDGTLTADNTITITVTPVNDPPTINPDTGAGDEETTITINVLANDVDVDSTIYIDSVGSSPNGEVRFSGSNLIFIPNTDFFGVTTVTYVGTDGQLSGTGTVTITVNNVQDAPVANDDAFPVTEDTPTLLDVLLNDIDVDGDSLTITAVTVTGPHGSATIINGREINFLPGLNENVGTSFVYTVSDGRGNTDTGSVTITVTPVNDAPVANSDVTSTGEIQAVTIDVLANDNDVDNARSTLTIGTTTDPSQGTIVINADNTITYTPNAGFIGTDSFTYTASDGTLSSSPVTVSVTVNDVNTLVATPDAPTVTEDTPVDIDVLANDRNTLPGGPLFFESITVPPSHGIVTVSLPSGIVTYTPFADYNGPDSFTYSVTDGTTAFASASVSFRVLPANDSPVAADDGASTAEDTAVQILVLGNDQDIDGDTLSVFSVDTTSANGGTLTLSGNVITFTPFADFHGQDTFNYVVTDGTVFANGRVTVNVSPVNDAPVASPDSFPINEDIVSDLDVLSNDSDADSDALFIASIVQPTVGGRISIVNNQIRFVPTPYYNGRVTFSYTATDGTLNSLPATVTVDIAPVENLPIANNDFATVLEDGTITFDVLANDIDYDDADTVEIDTVFQPDFGTVTNVGGVVTFTPDANFNGVATFYYTIVDGVGTAVVVITVSPANDAPSAVDDAATTTEETPVTVDVVGNDQDIDFPADTLTLIGNFVVSDGTASIENNQLVYTPPLNFAGTATVDYTIADAAGAQSIGTLTITVTNVNDSPTFNADVGTVDEDTTAVFDVLANDVDPDLPYGDSLFVTTATADFGTAVVENNQIKYTPPPNFSGTATVTYIGSDSQGVTGTATLTITVDPVNDSPVANDNVVDTDEDTPITFNPVADDTDEEGDTITITSIDTPSGGRITFTPANQVTFDPLSDFQVSGGVVTVNYYVSDGNGGVGSGSITIRIAAVNDAPTAGDDPVNAVEDTTLSPVIVDTNDFDIDGNTLTVTSVTQGSQGGSVTLLDGVIAYTPVLNYNGPETFTYTVSDGNGGTATATVRVTVASVNDAPVGVADSVAITENNANTFSVLANDNDVDVGDQAALVVFSYTQPASGTLALNSADNTFTYTPNPAYTGSDSFSYIAADPSGATTASVTVSLTVTSEPITITTRDDVLNISEDSGASTINVIANDVNSAGIVQFEDIAVFPIHGTAVHLSNGVIQYIPTADYFGTDTLIYRVNNGGSQHITGILTINIANVNDAPNAVDDPVDAVEDTPSTFTVTANDVDIDDASNTLQVIAVSATSLGSQVSFSGGSISYTPFRDATGTDTFTYTVRDPSGATDTATVTVIISAVNDAPVANGNSFPVVEDTPTRIDDLLLADDTDVDNGTPTIFSYTAPSHGTISVVLSTLVYTPDPDYNGPDSFSYIAVDASGAQSLPATVSITVTAVNDQPQAQPDLASTAEDTPVTFNVLANDRDVDNDPLSIISATVSSGSVTFDNTAGTLTYTPAPNAFGTVVITYTIDDGTLQSSSTATVSVASVNDVPVAGADAASTDEDTPVTIDVLANDSDVESTIRITGTTTTADGTITINPDSTLTFTPAPNFNGLTFFSYTITDGTASTTGRVDITVNPINDNPQANPDTFVITEDTPSSFNVLLNDVDPDYDTLYIISTSQPAHGVVIPSATGSIRYIPDEDFFGSDSFTYTITDGAVISSATVSIVVNPSNDPPVAQNDFAYVNEDGSVVVPVLNNDYDVDGDTIQITAVTATHGSATPQGSDILYTPNPDYFGIETITYTIADRTGVTATASVTVVVLAVNDNPVVRPDTVNGFEDTPISIPVLDNDSDPEGSPLTISGVTAPTMGTIQIIDNVLYYTPYPNANGVETFSYTATDGNGGYGSTTITINVAAVNDAATAGPDFASTTAGTPVTVPVLSNDSDAEGDTLTVVSTSTPPHGTITINDDYTITYTPSATFSGLEVITYTISDGTDTSTGTLIVTVAPAAGTLTANDDSILVTEDVPLNFDVLGNDVNTASNGAVIFRGIDLPPAHGTISQNPDGSFSYTPDANYNGNDVFVYSVTDGVSQVSFGIVTFTISAVNDAPSLQGDYASTNEDVPVDIPVLNNDIDIDGDALTITDVADPPHGTATIVGNHIRYVPDADYFGVDTFAYTVTDGNGGSTLSSITVAIASVNDSPSAAADTASFNEDVPTVIDVLANDSDPEGSPLTILFVSSSTLGTTTIQDDGTVLFTPFDNVFGTDSIYYVVSDGAGGISTASISITVNSVNDAPIVRDDVALTQSGSPIIVNVLANDYDVEGDSLTVTATAPSGTVVVNADNTITYTPATGASGTIPITYTATDSGGASGTATLYLTIIGTSLIAVPDEINSNEDTPYTFNPLANDINNLNPGQITLDRIMVQPLYGALVVNGDGTFTYTPVANFNGVDQFIYSIVDGTFTSSAVAFLFVAPVNDAPVAVTDVVVTREDTPTVIPALANDYDIDGDSLTITSVSTPSRGGTVTFTPNGPILYTPAANFFGTETFTYIASDGNGGTATGTITVSVSPVNEAPVANPDSPPVTEDTAVLIDVLANDVEYDGETLTITLITSPQHGTAVLSTSNSGRILYTPALNYNGPDSFTYTISDTSGFTSTASVSFNVSPVNDGPVVNRDVASLLEDTTVTIPVLANDFDVDGDSLTISSATASAGTVTIVGNSLVYSPPANFFGTVTITYFATDDFLTGSSTVTVTVVNVNDPPTVGNDSYNVVEDTPTPLAVLANDSDLDFDVLQITAFSTPAHGSLVRNGNTLTYTPALNYNGPDSFTYTVSDGNGGTSTGSVSINVTPVNDAPVSNPDSASTFEDTPVTIFPLANDSDVEGSTLTLTSVSDPPHGTVTFLPSGQIIYTPDANYFGTDTFTYTVTDGSTTSIGTITITITGVNDSPNAVNDIANAVQNDIVTVAVLDNDYDVDGDSFRITGITRPAAGSAVLNPDNTITFTPPTDYVGTITFGYTITDSNGATSSAVVSLIYANSGTYAPSINNDQLNVVRDQSNSINVLANDIVVAGFLTITMVTSPSQGTLQIDYTTGVIIYTPPPSFLGATSFTYTACDNFGSCGSATVFVSVFDSNASPVAISDSVLSAQVQPLNINVLANDYDPENDPFRIVSVTQPGFGQVTINADQTVTFIPSVAGIDHVATFTYTIVDSFGNAASASVQIVFENLPPSIVDDTFIVYPGQSLSLDVLANDFDADGDILSISDLSTTLRGTVSISADHLSLLYTAAPDFEGLTTFTYSASDSSGASGSATVTIYIVTPDDIIVVPDKATTNINTPITLNLLDNDLSIGSPLDYDTFSILQEPRNGIVTISPFFPGQVVYTPRGNFQGSDVFYYSICNEAGSCGSAGVTITVIRIFTSPFPTTTSAPVSTATRTTAPTRPPSSTNAPVASSTTAPTSTHGPQGSILPPIPYPTRTPARTAAAATNKPVPTSNYVRAMDDDIETESNEPVLIDVLLNDIGPVDASSLQIFLYPLYGTVSIEGDAIVYTPFLNWSGEDSFDYLICNSDRTSCDEGTVTVNVFDYLGYIESTSSACVYSASFLSILLALFFVF